MKTIKVTTQNQLDSIGFDAKVKIQIAFGTASDPAIVPAKYHYPVVARGNSYVLAFGNSSVAAFGSSTVLAFENSYVAARGNSFCTARGDSHVDAFENSHVEAWENSYVEAWENARIINYGCKYIFTHDNAVVLYVPNPILEG